MVREERDVHSITAARAAGLREPKTKAEFMAFKEQHKDERAIGKMSNFATIYLVSADSLSWQIFEKSDGQIYLTEKETQKYIDSFFNTFKHYKTYVDSRRVVLARNEWIVSDFGRRWLFPNTNAGLRQAINFPVQSTASDITILVLHRLYHELKRLKFKSRITAEIHDSAVLEVPNNELLTVVSLIQEIFENPQTQPFNFQLRIPLKVEISYGPSWSELKPYAWDFRKILATCM